MLPVFEVIYLKMRPGPHLQAYPENSTEQDKITHTSK